MNCNLHPAFLLLYALYEHSDRTRWLLYSSWCVLASSLCPCCACRRIVAVCVVIAIESPYVQTSADAPRSLRALLADLRRPELRLGQTRQGALTMSPGQELATDAS